MISMAEDFRSEGNVSGASRSFLLSVVRAVLFIAAAAGVILLLSYVMQFKDDEELTPGYFRYPENTFDVVFFGPSVMHYGVYPLELWEQYGIVSYNLGSANQSVPETYYLLKEVIEKDHPKLVVYDTTIFKETYKIQNYSNLHYITDNMPLTSEHRREMIEDLIPEDKREEFQMPLTIYHNRWKDLTKDDLHTGYANSTFGAKIIAQSNAVELNDALQEDSYTELNDVPSTYIGMIVDLCRETDTELLLTTFPIIGTDPSGNDAMGPAEFEDSVRTARFVDMIGAFHKLTHINFLCHPEYLELDPQTDTRDGHHLNVFGAQKMTAWLGAYIKENYEIPDRRGEQDTAFMDKALADYRRVKFERSVLTCNHEALYLEILKETYDESPEIFDDLLIVGVGDDSSDLIETAENAEENTSIRQIAILNRGQAVAYTAPVEETFSMSVGSRKLQVSGGESANILLDGGQISVPGEGAHWAVYNLNTGELLDSVRFWTNEEKEQSKHLFGEEY